MINRAVVIPLTVLIAFKFFTFTSTPIKEGEVSEKDQ
jgi:hypothetical protein